MGFELFGLPKIGQNHTAFVQGQHQSGVEPI